MRQRFQLIRLFTNPRGGIYRILIIVVLGSVFSIPSHVQAQTPIDHQSFLPIVVGLPLEPTPKSYLPLVFKPAPETPRINAPFFDGTIQYGEMAIFGMGQVTPTVNYADMRVGYNQSEIYIDIAIFDKRLWNDTTPALNEFDQWDSVTILLNTGNPIQATLTPEVFKFDLQAYKGGSAVPYRAVYQWGANGWVSLGAQFDLVAGWRGNDFNDNSDDRGWVARFHIPFSAIGLTMPVDASVWSVAVFMHDRDDAAGTAIPVVSWPQNAIAETPFTWGKLIFGLPDYTPPEVSFSQTEMIRENTSGTIVPDSGVGGTTGNLCPGDPYFIWNVWGNLNFGESWHFNIQNQGDVADWPCFSKYYVQFPLNSVPVGKKIVSATLLLHYWGGSNPALAQSSLIQVFTVKDDWQENSVTWNNGPCAWENVSRTWVHLPAVWPNWPKVPVYWDVSYAVDQAYRAGKPLSIFLYEADWAQNSGKYFTSSEAEEWNVAGRPTLFVEWGE